MAKYTIYKQGTTITNSELVIETLEADDVCAAAFVAYIRTGYSFVLVYEERTQLFHSCVVSDCPTGPWDVTVIKVARLDKKDYASVAATELKKEDKIVAKNATVVIKQAIKDMVKELKLNQYPSVVLEDTDENYVMSAGGTVYANGGWFNKTITKTECDYKLRINKKAVNNMLKRYGWSFGNKDAAYNCLYLLVCHELRHMWQYQEQWFTGRPFNNASFNSVYEGHGSEPEERDANEWMIQVAESKGMLNLAVYMELEQRADGIGNKYDAEFRTHFNNMYITAIKDYNKVLHVLCKALLCK